MAHVYYRGTSAAKVDHLSALERFLDDNHEKLSSKLHEELLDVYEEMNSDAEKELNEHESHIEDLQNEIEALKERVEELEDAND